MNELRYKYNTTVSDRTGYPARMFAPLLFSHLIREDRTREDRTNATKVQIYNCFFTTAAGVYIIQLPSIN